jgi:cyclopropane fatty-acyl-phospholipid synthase-like methyltransferase
MGKRRLTEIAAFMRQSGEAVIDSLGVTPPLRALDLGCGDGTTALPLTRLGADVTGIDIALRSLTKENFTFAGTYGTESGRRSQSQSFFQPNFSNQAKVSTISDTFRIGVTPCTSISRG